MATYSAGTATVDVIPSLKGFHQKIRRELKTVNEDIRVNVTPDLSGFKQKMAAGLKTDDVKVGVDADTKAAQSKIRRLHDNKTVRMTVEAVTKGAMASIAALRAIASRNVTLKVEADTARMAGALRIFSSITGAAIRTGLALALLTNGLGALGSAVGALAPMVGFLAAVPGLAFAAAGAIGAIALGVDGIKRAFQGAKGEFDRLRNAVAGTFQRALQPAVQNINAILPQLHYGFNRVAGALSGVANKLTQTFREQGVAQFNIMLSNTATLIRKIGDWLAPVFGAVVRFASASLAAVNNLTQGTAEAGNKAAAFIDRFANVHVIEGWLRNAAAAFRSLWQVLSDLGGIVSAVFRAFRAEGLGVAGVFGSVVARVRDFLDSVQGQQMLQLFARTLKVIADTAGTVLVAAFQALSPHMPVLMNSFQQIATTLGMHLVPILQTLIPLFVGLISFVAQNAHWLIPLALGLMMAYKALVLVSGAMRILNLIMMTSPIGLVITGIALAAGLIIMYWKPISGFFQMIWGHITAAFQWAWGIIRNVINWSWNSVIKPVFNAFRTAFNAVAGALNWFWNSVLRPVFSAIGNFVRWVWQNILEPTFRVFGAIFGIIAGTIMWWWGTIVRPIFNAVGTFIRWVWNALIKPAFNAMMAGIRWLGGVFSWLWNNVVRPVWNAIGGFLRWAWNALVKPVFNAIQGGLRFLGSVFSWLWNNVVRPVWNAISGAVRWAWNNIIRPTLGFLRAGLEGTGGVFNWLWNNVVRPVWDSISNAVSWAWNNVLKPTFEAIRTGTDRVGQFFENMGKRVGGIWDGLKKIVKGGIQAIIDFVWNDGVLAMWEKANNSPMGGVIPDPPGRIKLAKGGVLPGYAPGVDIVPAMLSPGEGVLVPEAVRILGADTINALNRVASRGRGGQRARGTVQGATQRFAAGGIVKPLNTTAPAATPPAAPAEPTTTAPNVLTFDIAALQRLGEVAEAVVAKLVALRNQLVQLVTQVNVSWGQIRAATVATATAVANSWLQARTMTVQHWDAIRTHVVTSANALRLAVTTTWAQIRTSGFTHWGALRAFLVTTTAQIRANVAQNWAGIHANVSTVWSQIRSNTVNTWNQIKSHANTTWTQISRHAHTTADQMARRQSELQTQYQNSWRAIRDNTALSVDAQNRALRGLRDSMHLTRVSMRNTADWARQQYGRIKGAAADPIRWTINNPFNEGLIRAWNRLNKDFNFGKRINKIVPHFARGGPVPGKGNKDTQPAMLMPGEYVLSRKAIANMGGVGAVDRMHQAAREGSPAYNLGRKPSDAARKHRLMQRVPADDVGHFAYGGVQPHVARAGKEIERKFGPFPGGIGGVGSRPNASDHPKGLALDFMSMGNMNLGDRVASYMRKNARRLLVKYLIWRQRINQGSGWKGMENRGSPTANHMDHVHASFLGTGQAGRAFGGGGGFFDPASIVNPAFAKTYRLIRQVNQKWPNRLPAQFAAGVARKAADRVKNRALERVGAMGGDPAVGVVAKGPAVAQVRAVARAYGWGQGPQWQALMQLIQKESSWNPRAANPTSSARGLFQKMTSIHGPVEPTAAGQAKWGLNYIRSRYGNPVSAWSFHRRNNYYDKGGLALGRGFLAKNTLEPERVLSPAQTRSFDRLVADIGRGRIVSSEPEARSGPFIGELNVIEPSGATADQIIDSALFKARHASRSGRYRK